MLQEQGKNDINSDYYEDYINPKRYQDDQTMAIKLAIKGIIPDKKYIHEPEIRDKYNNTVCYYLFNNNISIPEEWKDKQYKNPEKNEFDSRTDAIHQALLYRRIPNKKYYHDPNIKDDEGFTVAHYLKQNKIPVPNQWYDDSMKNTPKQPLFIQQAMYGIIPEKPNNVFSDYDCGFKQTVAMLLACNNKQIPKEWQHKPELQNDNGDTVAMIYAKYGYIPPQEWEHDPEIQNEGNYTVSMILASYGIIPPNQWFHNPSLKNWYGGTVEYILKKNNRNVPPQWKVEDS